MPRPSRSREIDDALLREVERHPADLVRVVAEALGLSRAAVAARARALLDTHYLQKSGTTRPRHALGSNRHGHTSHRLAGLAEDRVWSDDIAPLLTGLPRNVIDICHHGVTEMVNNAIDHSEGRTLDVRIERTPERVGVLVTDDGIGIFRKITRALDLPDERLALLELSKGKLTTDPRRHSGEGIFFTSRVFDAFRIRSGGLVFDHDAAQDDDVLFEQERIGANAHGTEVAMEIEASSARTLKQVFDEYSSGPDDYAFARTIVPVRLARVGDENLISRSQAKRLMQRLDRFSKVVLDFEGVTIIGQAFADEIFRVFANEHPAIELITMRVLPEVQQMIRRAEVARDEQARLPPP
jgi:anti-sigma regulatory factor (Ser/Thr protein kinase)